MRRPVILDLFCGAGGAAMGYSRAGFDVVGVDINPQPRYPFEFHQGNAMNAVVYMLAPYLKRFDAIHASPPCQRYSRMSNCKPGLSDTYPDLVDPIRQLLIESGIPWIIENVPDSPVRPDYELCGCMFGMKSRRPRWFETSWGNFGLNLPHHHERPAFNPQNQRGRELIRQQFGKGDPDRMWREDVGVEWMNRAEGREAIPPAFTEFIGRQLMDYLTASTKESGE